MSNNILEAWLVAINFEKCGQSSTDKAQTEKVRKETSAGKKIVRVTKSYWPEGFWDALTSLEAEWRNRIVNDSDTGLASRYIKGLAIASPGAMVEIEKLNVQYSSAWRHEFTKVIRQYKALNPREYMGSLYDPRTFPSLRDLATQTYVRHTKLPFAPENVLDLWHKLNPLAVEAEKARLRQETNRIIHQSHRSNIEGGLAELKNLMKIFQAKNAGDRTRICDTLKEKIIERAKLLRTKALAHDPNMVGLSDQMIKIAEGLDLDLAKQSVEHRMAMITESQATVESFSAPGVRKWR